jgi:hypothetical protein
VIPRAPGRGIPARRAVLPARGFSLPSGLTQISSGRPYLRSYSARAGSGIAS